MNTKITYKRGGRVFSLNIQSRLAPNPLAVKFVVLEHELKNGVVAQFPEHSPLDEMLDCIGIQILNVEPESSSDVPKPYGHRPGGI